MKTHLQRLGQLATCVEFGLILPIGLNAPTAPRSAAARSSAIFLRRASAALCETVLVMHGKSGRSGVGRSPNVASWRHHPGRRDAAGVVRGHPEADHFARAAPRSKVEG